MSRYDGTDRYTYPGSDVLINKPGITDSLALEAFEADATGGAGPDQFINRLGFYMGEINAAHPFREGNGRVQRVFCAQLALNAGYFIDFESVDQAQMYAVMAASFNGDASPLVALLNEITAIVEP